MFKWFLQKKSRRIEKNQEKISPREAKTRKHREENEKGIALAYQADYDVCCLCEKDTPDLVTTVFYRKGYDLYPGNYQYLFHHESCYEYIRDNVPDKDVLQGNIWGFFHDIQDGKKETKQALKEKAKKQKQQKEWKEIQIIMRDGNNDLDRPEPLILNS